MQYVQLESATILLNTLLDKENLHRRKGLAVHHSAYRTARRELAKVLGTSDEEYRNALLWYQFTQWTNKANKNAKTPETIHRRNAWENIISFWKKHMIESDTPSDPEERYVRFVLGEEKGSAYQIYHRLSKIHTDPYAAIKEQTQC